MKKTTVYQCQGICPKCKEFVLTGEKSNDKYDYKHETLEEGDGDKVLEKKVMRILHKDCSKAISLMIKSKSYQDMDNEGIKESVLKSFIRFFKSFLRIG